MHKLRENAEKELKAIEEKGLTSSNLDNAYKLVEIMKGVDKIEMMEQSEGEYSRDREDYSSRRYSRDNYDNENSYRRGRNQRTGEYMHRPNYSRLSGDDTDIDEYRSRKREYSNARSGENKDRMLDSLDRLVGKMCDCVAQFHRDCDCPEERDIIEGHLEGLQRKIKR